MHGSVGQELGLPADIAHLLTLQTALGAAKMAIEVVRLAEVTPQCHPWRRRKNIRVFGRKELHLLVKQAHATKLRSEELSGEKH